MLLLVSYERFMFIKNSTLLAKILFLSSVWYDILDGFLIDYILKNILIIRQNQLKQLPMNFDRRSTDSLASASNDFPYTLD